MPTPEIGEYEGTRRKEIYAASINPIDFKLRDGKSKIAS